MLTTYVLKYLHENMTFKVFLILSYLKLISMKNERLLGGTTISESDFGKYSTY